MRETINLVQPTRKSALQKKYEEIRKKREDRFKEVKRAGIGIKKRFQKTFKMEKCKD